MKKLVFMLIMAPGMAWGQQAGASQSAQSPPPDKFSEFEAKLGPALRLMMDAGEAQACGYRSLQWTLSVNAAVNMAAAQQAQAMWNPVTESATILNVSKRFSDYILGAYGAGASINPQLCSIISKTLDYPTLDKMAKIGGDGQ